MSDLDLDRVRAAIAARRARAPSEAPLRLGEPLLVLSETTSTNDLAKRAAKEGAPHGATFVAERQTSGRGRQGRAWVAEAGDALLVSVLARVGCAPSRVPPLAIAAGLAACDALARALPEVPFALKWPNDVVLGEKKVAGILVEATTAGARVEGVIVGVGVNVHTRAFAPEIADRATSLALLAPRAYDRAEILAELLVALDRDLDLALARGLEPLRARLEATFALRGARVASESGDSGQAVEIDQEGRLVVQRDDGSSARWSAGEVHLVRA